MKGIDICTIYEFLNIILYAERKQWPQFVAATDTQLQTFQASDPPATGEKAAKSHEPMVTESSGAVSVASSEGKDDIDTKLKDFLAVRFFI